MEKSKSKIPVRRPYSDQSRNKESQQINDPSDLRRISSDLSKPKNRNNENDENSVHSLNVNSANLRVRRFTVTIKDSKGEFVKRKKSYKLTYDKDKDGGDEYAIERDSVSDTSTREVNNTQDVLKDLSNNNSVNGEFDDASSIRTEQSLLSKDQKDNDNSLTVPANVPPIETEVSQTNFTDDTSLPVLDDDSSESNVAVGDTYNRDNSASLHNLSPISGKTIRLLTPQDRNETNILFKNRSLRRIATVRKAEQFASKEKEAIDPNNKTNETDLDIEATPVSKEGTSNSLPPSNFKTNLFNRVRKISTPRRTPKFSPVLDQLTDQNSKTENVPHRSETTFVKDSSAKRFERIASSESVRGHYDKKLKLVFGEVNSNMNKSQKERYEAVNLDKTVFALKPKRHRRSLETSKMDERLVKETDIPTENDRHSQAHTNQTSGLITKSAIFSKPVLKHPVKASQFDPQEKVLLKTNHYIETSENDIFSEQDKKSKLKQAQYINDDLRIVKTKLQDSEFVAQHLDTKLRETIQKKNVLSNLNKNSAIIKEPEKTRVLQKSMIGHNFNETYMKPELKKSQTYQSDTFDEFLDDDQTNVLDLQKENQVKTAMSNANTNSRTDLDRKQNIWQVQPKIHRFNPNKDRNLGTKPESNSVLKHTSKSSSVAAWVLHSARGANRKERPDKSLTTSKAPLQARRKALNKKWKLIQTKEIQKKQKHRKEMQRKDSKSKEIDANLINSGMYLPLGRNKLKRRPKRLRPRLYTQVGKVKGYESEIPVLPFDSDEEQVYPEPRPLTDTAERRYYPNYRRYEGEHDNVRINFRDPAHRKAGRSCGSLVKFYRNGDPHYKGMTLTINRDFKAFETLLFYLSDNIPTPTGIHHIFKWPEGNEIKSVTEFQNRCVYIVSSTKELKRKVKGVEIRYGKSREEFWSNKKMSAGRMRKNEAELYTKPKGHKESPVRNLPVVVTIINNLSRDKREKIILNPQTKQAFEDWLEDISNPAMPVQTLYSDNSPYLQIKSFSQLFREHQANSNFIACGDEFKPLELLKKRQASSSNSSTDSIGDSKYRKKKLQKQQDMGQIYENGRPESPTSTAMSRYDAGPRFSQSHMHGRTRDSRKSTKDTVPEKMVEIEVDGVFKDFYPPSYTAPTDDGTKPGCMLKCEWVYGFRGRDTRHNLMVLPQTGELVYYVACMVVLYDKENDTQRHYIKHNEEITCMTIHPNQYLVATGQMHGKESEHASHIRIWDGVSLSTYSVIGLGVFYGGILSIGFSQDKPGIYMCALDGSEKHVLSVWDWQTERVVARTTTSTDPVHCACFYPDGSNNSILITYGARHIYFWKIFYDVARRREAKILRDRNSGIFEEEVPMSINCIAFLRSGDVVTGDSSGHLMIWDRDSSDAFTCKHVVQAHDSSISSLCLIEDGTLLSASAKDIKAWDTYYNFRHVKTRQIPPTAGEIMTIVTHVPGGSDGRLYVGTTNNAILDGSLQHKFKYVVQGHRDGVWCVAPHQIEPTFFSAGFDQVVYKWGLTYHNVIWRTQVQHPCTSIATLSKTKLCDIVAVGTATGTIYILHAFNGLNITSVNIGTEPIGCLAFSFDEALLAAGCNDGFIHVYHMLDRKTFNKVKVTSTCHKSGVLNLDWSKDGRSIESSSFDNELMFWNTDTMDPVEVPATMRNVEWITTRCPMSYSLIGPWSTVARGEIIKVACRSPNNALCITGDSKGRVRLYKYPCTKERAECRSVRIYSSDVTAIAFGVDNCSVFTCGGNDAALVQWELVDE